MTATVTFQQGAGYLGTIDTALYQQTPNQIAGDGTRVQIDSGTGIARQGLLAFTGLWGDAPGQIPFGAVIISATLTLSTVNESAAAASLYRMTAAWDEQSTWNLLGNGVQIGVETVGTADLVVGSVSTGSRGFDVTKSLAAWQSGAASAAEANLANRGWLFASSSTDGWDFSSSEGATVPKLTVTYALASEFSSQLALAGPVSRTEGTSAASSDFLFTVERSGDLSQPTSVAYAVTAGGPNAANYADFAGGALPSGRISFAPGESAKTITIKVVADGAVEASEQFEVTLSGAPSGVLITNAHATGTIINDDSAPAVLGVNVFAGSSLGVPGSSGSDRFGSPDPTGITYNAATGRYFIVDSEIDESPFFGSVNLLQMDGSGQRVDGTALTNFTSEPTGIAAWNALDGAQRLFICDDNLQRVFQVDPANPGVVLSSFSTTSFGCSDPEDISINPVNGNLFVLSENDRRIYEVTQAGKLVSTVQLPASFAPIPDPNAADSGAEGLAYDPVRDVFYVAGGFSTDIFVISRAGTIVDTIDILTQYPQADGLRVYPKGLALGPASDGSGQLSLWVADYGRDQVAEGRLIEIILDQSASAPIPATRTLNGTAADDMLSASTGERWVIDGLGGNDSITTLSGNDTVIGGTGNDRIVTGAGNDLIRFSGSGHGFDSIDGGAGVDRIEAAAKSTVIGLTSVSGVELITANGFSSVTISGSSAADVLDFSDVTLLGIGSIKGGSGADTVYGSNAKDTIVGGSGADALYGNGGSDVFDYNSVTESSLTAADRIFDFTRGSDKIDLKSIDAVSATSSDQAFTFIGSAAFSGTAGQLRIDTSDPNQTVVLGDVNGDGVADLSIIVMGSVPLTSSDFLL